MANLSDLILGGSGVITASGFYIPTATVRVGTTSVQPYMNPHYWYRIGDNVCVFGSTASVSPSAGDIMVSITLPVATANFTTASDATGLGMAVYSPTNLKESMWIRARSPSSQEVEIWHEGSTTNNYGWFYSFTYEIQS